MTMCRIGSEPGTTVGVGVGPGVPVTVPVGVPVAIETCASERSLVMPYQVTTANSAEMTSSMRTRSRPAPEDLRIIAPLPSALTGYSHCLLHLGLLLRLRTSSSWARRRWPPKRHRAGFLRANYLIDLMKRP